VLIIVAVSLRTPEQVFITDGYPELTYVNQAGGKPEAELQEGLGQANKIISIVGASKTGKSTLCDKYFGSEKILIPGGRIENMHGLWSEAYRQIGGKITEGYARNVLGETLDALTKRGLPVVLDDFHYVDRQVQRVICQQMKNEAARGLRFIVINTPHRGDDPIRNNSDLSGRFFKVDLQFWTAQDLMEIGKKGFSGVGLRVSGEVLDILAREALGSPQLMQTLCLETCRSMPEDTPYEQQTVDHTNFDIAKVREKTVRSYDHSTALHYLREGPGERGRARNVYTFQDGSTGDVYTALVRCLTLDPPFVSITLGQIKARVSQIVMEGEMPNMAAALSHLNDLFKDDYRPMEWDGDKELLWVVDPHFYFYLRCKPI